MAQITVGGGKWHRHTRKEMAKEPFCSNVLTGTFSTNPSGLRSASAATATSPSCVLTHAKGRQVRVCLWPADGRPAPPWSDGPAPHGYRSGWWRYRHGPAGSG